MRTNCPNCGAVVNFDDDRCAYCGTPYVEKPERCLLTMTATGYTLRALPTAGTPGRSIKVDADGITYQIDGGAPVLHRLRPDELAEYKPAPITLEHGSVRRDNWLTRCFGIKSPSEALSLEIVKEETQ